MADKLDFKKEYQDLCGKERVPVLLTVPPIHYLMVDGNGAPEGEQYQESLGILYSLAFAVKMKNRGTQDHGDFTVPPLEGLWNCAASGYSPDRNSWKWTSMLRMPNFVTAEDFENAKAEVHRKKSQIDLSKARFEVYEEGLCIQMLHIGPYSTEQDTIDQINLFRAENNFIDECGTIRRHHEIYLSDPRKCAPERMKTIIRHPVSKR